VASEEQKEPASSDDDVRALALQAIDRPEQVRQLSQLDPFERQRHRAGELDLALREKYANWLLIGLGSQIAVADLAFYLYAIIGAHWKIATATMDVWLGATVIQVISVVGIVVRYLFPQRSE
jgi:hypothetical protein